MDVDTGMYVWIVAELCGLARTVWGERTRDGPSMGRGGGRRLCCIPYTARVPACGLRTVIVIPIDALKIPDAGRIHAIHGQGLRKLERAPPPGIR